MMQQPIYLDYNATTPVDPLVLEAMLPYLREHFGNPSSSHVYGVQARAGVEKAREQVASLLSCHPDEIVFTSGGSESNNLVIKGIAEASRNRGDHIITSQVEHPAVLETCRYLERRGFQVTYLPVNGLGWVNPKDVEPAITNRTILITIMHANNEVGTIQPIAAIGQIARTYNIPFHTDAAQSVGKIPAQVDELQVDLLTVAGHAEPSAVLLAMGVSRELALGTVRFSLGRWTTKQEVDQTVTLLVERLNALEGRVEEATL